MVTGRNILMAAALAGSAAFAGTAVAQDSAAKPDAAVQQLLQNCDAHKFETIVKAVVDGQPRQSKVKLCGKDGQSDADWIGTLNDAIAKLHANKEMEPAVRDQIVTAINAEIVRLKMGISEAPKQQALTALPDLKPRQLPRASAPVEYSALPPMPTTPPPPPRVMAPAAGSLARGWASTSAATVSLLPAYPAPKLSFACYNPTDLGGDAPCIGFERETVLTVRAGEDLRKGIQLRFARNGEERATVDLAQLRRGKSVRISLPRDVCQGFADGRLDLQVLEGGYVVESQGPFTLRC